MWRTAVGLKCGALRPTTVGCVRWMPSLAHRPCRFQTAWAISPGGGIRLSRATAAVVDWLQANLRAPAADLAMGTGASREICPVDLTSPGQHVLATHHVSFPVFANLEVAAPLPGTREA